MSVQDRRSQATDFVRSVKSLTAVERETTVTTTDEDDEVRIWTCRPKHLTALRRHPAFTEVASGFYGTTEWAEFTIAEQLWSPATGAKRKGHPVSPASLSALLEHRNRKSAGE